MDIIQIFELVGAAVAGGWITHLLTIRSRVRQERAGASKAEAEAEENNIENIRKTMDGIYKPMLDDLRQKAVEAMNEAAEARRRADEAMDKVIALEAENRELRRENATLRDAIREINPDLVPSRRSENSSRHAANQPRGKGGRFIKKVPQNDDSD